MNAAPDLASGDADGVGSVAVDHHTHLVSPTVAAMLGGTEGNVAPRTADDLIGGLDADGVTHATVLSTAYLLAAVEAAPELRASVARDNDWTADQVRRYPDRLVAYLSVNPLDDDAIEEIQRCVARGGFVGLKLHLASADVDLRDPAHLRRLRAVAATADGHGLAIAVHLRTRRVDFGRSDCDRFFGEIVRDVGVPVQVAHLGGWGGYDAPTDAALEAATAAASDLQNIYVDISAAVVGNAADPDSSDAELLRRRVRHFAAAAGAHRVLFGTDWPLFTPRAYKSDVARCLRLGPAEWRSLFLDRPIDS